ncbi:MAG: hypothetical protein HYW37_01850 [Candidatus Colwellbacteria bacterium]|nr:hypothetical protein [Candidatus Colwellbacteria bacterium]
MKELQKQVSVIIELIGFKDFRVDSNEDESVISVTIGEGLGGVDLPDLVANLNRLVRLLAKKLGAGPVLVDVNNYRRDRERLILKLARAAARKAVATKGPVELPAMNSYERRLVHAELATRPDVKTESVGEEGGRYVVVRAIEEN